MSERANNAAKIFFHLRIELMDFISQLEAKLIDFADDTEQVRDSLSYAYHMIALIYCRSEEYVTAYSYARKALCYSTPKKNSSSKDHLSMAFLNLVSRLWFNISPKTYLWKWCACSPKELRLQRTELYLDLVSRLWKVNLRPSLLKWWLCSPKELGLVSSLSKKTIFIFLFGIMAGLAAYMVSVVMAFGRLGLFFHNRLGSWMELIVAKQIEVPWNLLVIILGIIIFIIFFPQITKVKVGPIEMEMPPRIDPPNFPNPPSPPSSNE